MRVTLVFLVLSVLAVTHGATNLDMERKDAEESSLSEMKEMLLLQELQAVEAALFGKMNAGNDENRDFREKRCNAYGTTCNSVGDCCRGLDCREAWPSWWYDKPYCTTPKKG
uniref:U22-Hexatoxin-Hf1b_1 n=1 Tax=Hadronyche formidabilis TaxID=426499 RepID=A0A4Q8K971_HADFO